MLQVYKNNHCSLIKAALICGESKESQKQHLLQDTLAQPKSLQVIYVSYLTSFCSSSCFLTCLFGYVDARHLRAATSQRRRSTVRRRCYLLLLLGYWWPLAPGRSWTMGRPAWSMALVWEQAQGAFSKSGPGLPGEAGREMWRGCSGWLCTGRMTVKGHVRFSKGLALLQRFGGCSDAYSNPSGPGSAEGIPPSGSACAVAPCFYSSFSCFARTVSWLC